MNFCRQPDAASFLTHVNQNAVAFLLDLPKRGVQLIATIASPRAEHVAGKTLTVDPHERWFVFVNFPFHECEMMLAIKGRPIQMQIEIAVVGRHFHDLLNLHQFFAHATIGDQTLDRANA